MNVVYAKSTMTVSAPDGAPVLIQFGQHWSANDPIVRAYPQHFSSAPQYGLTYYGDPPAEMSEPPVEQVTAGPGERRNVSRRG